MAQGATPAAETMLPESDRRGLIATAYAGMAVFGLVLLLMGSLLPSLRVSLHQAGNLGSLPLLGILIATLVVGPWLDTAGAKPILAVALLLVAGPLALMPSLATYAGLAIAAFVYGFGGGLLNTATNALVSDLSALQPSARAGEQRGIALNLLGFFFSVGAIGAPLLMALVSDRFSAAVVLRILAACTAAVLVPVLAFRFPPPSHAGQHPLEMLRVLRTPLVWWFSALLFFESANENSMFVWAGKLVQTVLHTRPQQAAAALVALSAAIGIGRLFAVGWLRWLGNRGTLLLSSAVIVAGAAVTGSGGGYAAMLTGLAMIGLGISAIYPTVLGLAGTWFPRETGTVFGGIMTVALVGGTAGPWLASRLAPGHPRQVLWLPVAAALVVAALSGVVARQSGAEVSG